MSKELPWRGEFGLGFHGTSVKERIWPFLHGTSWSFHGSSMERIWPLLPWNFGMRTFEMEDPEEGGIPKPLESCWDSQTPGIPKTRESWAIPKTLESWAISKTLESWAIPKTLESCAIPKTLESWAIPKPRIPGPFPILGRHLVASASHGNFWPGIVPRDAGLEFYPGFWGWELLIPSP